MRGYCGIGLVRPKTHVNVGSALRAAYCLGADFIAVVGRRYERAPTDTVKAIKHVPLFHYDDIFQGLPFDCVPVAVDLIEGAVPLPAFQHSDRMFYIFGPEDGTLGKAITTKCKYVVQIPSRHCLNLAAAVNIILYDRNTKRRQLCMKSQAAACNIGINEVCTEALNA